MRQARQAAGPAVPRTVRASRRGFALLASAGLAAVTLLAGPAAAEPGQIGSAAAEPGQDGSAAAEPGQDASGRYRPSGEKLPTVQTNDDNINPDEAVELVGGVDAVDPGRYRLSLTGGDGGQLARIDKDPATTMWVTLLVGLPEDPEYADEIVLQATTPSGVECAKEELSVSDGETAFTGPFPIGMVIGPSTMDDEDDARACMSADQMVLGVTHSPDEEGTEIAAEMVVIEEPAVSGADALPSPTEPDEEFQPTWTPGKKAKQASGAVSYAEAPTMRPGRYEDTIQPGHTRIYRVDVGWGQRVQATMNLDPLSSGQAARLPDDGLPVDIAIGGPARRLVATGTATPVTSESGAVIGARTPEVRYRNREDSDIGGGSAGAGAMAGPYYIAVSARTSPDVPELALSYELDIEVSGKVSGAPEYTGPGTPSNQPTTTETASVRQTAQEKQSGDSPWPVLGPVLVGVAATGLVLVAGLALRRRSRD